MVAKEEIVSSLIGGVLAGKTKKTWKRSGELILSADIGSGATNGLVSRRHIHRFGDDVCIQNDYSNATGSVGV